MFTNKDQTLEIHLKVRLSISDLEKASKLTIDNYLIEDEYGNVFAPMLCLERIEGSGSNLYTDENIKETLGLEVEEHIDSGIYLKED
jgi:hypothetical protein